MGSDEVCKDYLRGDCNRANCKFAHPKDAEGSQAVAKPDAAERQVCQDFLRNACGRGDRCKYAHVRESNGSSGNKSELRFCHDFQNRGCARLNCRFVHCAKYEEEDYLKMGKISDNLARAILRSGQGSVDNIAGIAICKDFVAGKCERGRAKCKYWHFSPEEDPSSCQPGMQYGGGGQAAYMGGGADAYGYGYDQSMGMGAAANNGYGYGGGYGYGDYGGVAAAAPAMKRMRMDGYQGGVMAPANAGGVAAAPAAAQQHHQATRDLQEENLVMRQKVEILKKQVSDLTAANEVLLEQNARLRAKMQVDSGMADSARSMASVASSVASAQVPTTSVLAGLPAVSASRATAAGGTTMSAGYHQGY